MRPLLTLEDVAARMQVEPAWLRARIGTLCTKHGFPRALPLRGIRRWDPLALEIWQNGMLAGCGVAVPVDVAIATAEAAQAAVAEKLRAASLADEEAAVDARLNARLAAYLGQPLEHRPWSAPKVARELGVEAAWFRQNFGLLSARLAFPRPLPNLGFRYPCWDRLAIAHWRRAAPDSTGASLPDRLHSAPIVDPDAELRAGEDDPWTMTTQRRPRQAVRKKRRTASAVNP